MKAAVFYGKEDLRIEEVPEPEPGAGQVKLRIAYSGICGSDLHIYYDPDNPGTGVDYSQPHPLTGTTLPQIPGHEISGTVTAVGDGVSRVVVGDKVAVWPLYFCGTCAACEIGAVGACLEIAFHGVSSDGGGMAEFTVVDESMVHRLPEQLDLVMGALVEPMAVGWHAVEISQIEAGQTALIVGAGPIGVGVMFALKARGVRTIVVSEPSASRRAAIERLGEVITVDPLEGDLDAAVRTATEGRGVDYAYDAAGNARALPQVIALLRPRGALVIVALHERGFDFNPVSLLWQETRMIASRCYSHADYDAVIEAMAAGLYSAEGWVDVVELDDAASALRSLRGAQAMKILIRAD